MQICNICNTVSFGSFIYFKSKFKTFSLRRRHPGRRRRWRWRWLLGRLTAVAGGLAAGPAVEPLAAAAAKEVEEGGAAALGRGQRRAC